MNRLDFLKAAAMTPVAIALGLRDNKTENFEPLKPLPRSLPFRGEIGEGIGLGNQDSIEVTTDVIYVCYMDKEGNTLQVDTWWGSLDEVDEFMRAQMGLNTHRSAPNELEVFDFPINRTAPDVWEKMKGDKVYLLYHC